MQKIKEMNVKQLKRFAIINDMDVDIEDLEDEPEDLRNAIVSEVQSALGDTKDKGKKDKGKKDKDDDDGEIEVGSVVNWTDEDGDPMKGVVVKIKGKGNKQKAVVKDDDDDEFTVLLSKLSLDSDDDNGDDDNGDDDNGDDDDENEIEVGSDVEWEDEDGDDHEGKVVEIKGKKAKVKEGKKKVTVPLEDLTLA